MRAKPPAAFKTRSDIARYFGGNTIECLICGRRFKVNSRISQLGRANYF